MSSKKDAMKKKLENMHLGERINYGYRMVITMMLISGLLSIAVIGVLFFNMLNYVNKVNAADQAVKTCRINVNAAARNVREMALNPDKSTYDDYEQGAKEKLEDVDVQLKTIKNQVSFLRISIMNIQRLFLTGRISDTQSWIRLKPDRRIGLLIRLSMSVHQS